MVLRPSVHLLLALVALFATEPLHGWLHAGEPGRYSHEEAQELHDGACEHLPEHREEDDCLLCTKDVGDAWSLTTQDGTSTPADTDTCRPVRIEIDADDDPLVGVLGARAPPQLG